MSYTEKTLRCRDCETQFVFTVGEQQFFTSKGLVNDPVRCPSCRAARRSERGSGDGAGRVMHEVTCAECGGLARVPFVPRNEKPVYCSNCFERLRAPVEV